MFENFTWSRNGKILKLSGKLNRYLLIPLWNIRYEVVQGIQNIDLCNVSCTDTAGVALLIHLVAIGKIQGVNITLIGVNDNFRTLVKLYNIHVDILPYSLS